MPHTDWNIGVEGMMLEPPRAADGSIDVGRFTLPDVQATVNAPDVVLTSVLTARQLAIAAETRLLWTDQNVQRGIRPELDPQPSALLPVGDGYPDPTRYVFDDDNADDIVEKLLAGQRLYLNPLVWNLRPGTFEAYFDTGTRHLHIYSGRVFLPDSHHRHQAIVRAAQLFQEAAQDYPAFSIDRQFSVEVYFMTPDEEAEYFFEKNQLGKRADRSRAYQLTTQDAFALTAKRFAELCPSLRGNVNRVTDRLTARNPQAVTLSTLRTMAEAVLGEDTAPSPADVERTAAIMSRFYEMLAAVRPELGVLGRDERSEVRATLLVDQAVMMHGYAQLMRSFVRDLATRGEDRVVWWTDSLAGLAATHPIERDGWSGDFFSRDNPTWRRVGVLQETRSGRTAVSNTRQTREVCGQLLLARVTEFASRDD